MSLSLLPGHIVGLVGANGAGKSTLMRHLIGLLLPESGECQTFGVPSHQLSDAQLMNLTYVEQQVDLIPWLSGEEYLHFVKSFYPRWNDVRAKSLVDDLDIDLRPLIGTLSPGNQQKIALVAAIAPEPKLLILDEPAGGLDPLARSVLTRVLVELIQDGNRSLIVSSHILTDIEKIVDHLWIIDDGILIRNCSLDALREEYMEVKLAARGDAFLPTIPFSSRFDQRHNRRTAVFKIRGLAPETMRTFAVQNNLDIEIKPVTLEDIYRLEVKPS